MEDMDEKIVAVTGKLSPYGSRNLDIDRAIFRAGIREVVEWIERYGATGLVEQLKNKFL